MRTEQPKVIHLKDYQAPDYLIDETHLKFELFEDHSLVHAELKLRRNPERGAGLPPLLLHGQQLELLALELDGQALGADDYQLDDEQLGVQPRQAEFVLRARCVSIRRATPRWKACTSPARCSAPSARPRVSARSPITSTVPT